MRVGASRLRRRAGPRAGQVPRAAGPRRALDAHPVALLDRPRPLRPVPAFRGDHRGGDRLTAATATATATATAGAGVRRRLLWRAHFFFRPSSRLSHAARGGRGQRGAPAAQRGRTTLTATT